MKKYKDGKLKFRPNGRTWCSVEEHTRWHNEDGSGSGKSSKEFFE